MAKYIEKKKKRKKLSFAGKTGIFMCLTIVGWLFVSVFGGSINRKLEMDIQRMSNEVMALKTENQHLTVEIQTLQNKDRVFTIAKDAGLNQNQDNVLTITRGE